jgi:hypothetical protein
LDVFRDPIINNPISIPMLPNPVNAQLSKEIKQQIEKNDASSIELKMRTQADIDVKITLKKTLVNVKHIHIPSV